MRTHQLISLFCLFFASMMLVSSCEKDESRLSSGFTINGETRPLSKGFIDAFGDNGNGSFGFGVKLVSDGITVDAAGDLAGSGDLIALELNSSSASDLTEGRYTFSSDSEALTLGFGTITTDLDLVNGTGAENLFEIIDGTVHVELSGSETFLILNLNMSNGSTVIGSFGGVLQPF